MAGKGPGPPPVPPPHRGPVREPSVHPDFTYLFLAFVGLLYLAIGLFTVARERAPASRVFWALCLSSFAIYVITPAGPHDSIWKLSWLAEDFFRALLPALLLHLFLIFPRPARSRRFVPLLYLPAVAYIAAQPALLAMGVREAARAAETATRFWFLYFAVYAVAVIARLAKLLRTRDNADAEKQTRWVALGVTVGLAPFVLLSAVPRALGFASPLLSTIAVIPLVFIPLAFAWAILRWRLWDVEIYVREAVAATGAVLLGGMTFVLLNALLDRTLVGMAAAGKNVIAFASGLVLASLLVPVKRRLTDALEKIQYRETYRARRALLDVAREFSTPRPKEELVNAIVRRVEEGLHVVPCSLFLLENGDGDTPEGALLAARLGDDEVWRLRASAFGEGEPAAAQHLHAMGYRTFFAMRSGGKLAGALGVGHKDGRVPLSSEDESLLSAVMAQAGLAYENARLYARRFAHCSSTRRASSAPPLPGSSFWTEKTVSTPRTPRSRSWWAARRPSSSVLLSRRSFRGSRSEGRPRETRNSLSKAGSPGRTAASATCASRSRVSRESPTVASSWWTTSRIA